MAKHASKQDAPADIHSAVDLVSELAADAAAKKESLQSLQTKFEAAEVAKTDAEAKLKDAEEALLKAARAHKPEKPTA